MMNTTPFTALTEANGFIAIPVKMLRIDELADFELHLLPRGLEKPVLYRGANLPFTEEALDRLKRQGLAELWVPASDRANLRAYVEHHMGDILTDDTIPVEHRSTLMYESAQGLVRDVMLEPRSGQLIERSAELVPHMIQFIFEEGKSFEHLMKVCSYDYYTYTHSVNVFTYCVALAQHVGHTQEEVQTFGQGALLHDLGKSRLPLDVVNSPGSLSDEQWELMRLHPVYGYDLLIEQGVTDPVVLDVTRHHHEKLNGKGYPDGLKGDEISRWARMCTIVDIFDALTTRRSYKEARQSFDSLQFMHAHMADELDPELFRAFVGLMGSRGK
ncbi:MAG: HD domain-containing protein [Candidatus Hydrogenedens sp.]|nr:HD domain-containing protein [Candidatus Hydrogenedens sp.]